MTAPHPPLRQFYDSDAERQAFVTRLFDRSARHYDRINATLSLGLGLRYRRHALARAGLRRGMTVLDVATGTGLVARAAVELVGDPRRVVGLDPSAGMLRQAGQTVAIPRVQGIGERLPFADEQFDLVTMGYALRHVPDLDVAFAEYFRVLRPGGRVLLLEIAAPPAGPALALARWYLGVAVPRLTRLLTRSADAELLTRYYWETIAECVPAEVILAALRAGRFAPVRRRTVATVLNEYEGVKP